MFSELYGAYYTAVSQIIKSAIERPLEKGEFRTIAEKHAFGESAMNIEAAIKEERWQLIRNDGKTSIVNVPTMPLTMLQKQWLKAISLDPRMKLFGEEIIGLEDVEPLFTAEDYLIFDQYADGDPYEEELYIRNFRLIMDAIKNRYSLRIKTAGRKGQERSLVVLPEYLEYSQKDDKFRLIGTGRKYGDTINLGRIISCERYEKEYVPRESTRSNAESRIVEFELYDERRAMERVLLHFAHFKKQAERIGENTYKVSLTYEKDDETEILIRLLSFGPMVKVIGPECFVNLIKERLMKQKSCEH